MDLLSVSDESESDESSLDRNMFGNFKISKSSESESDMIVDITKSSLQMPRNYEVVHFLNFTSFQSRARQ